MVPILNHSLFINRNSNIINVIVEITNDIGLDNTILLYLKFTSFIVFPSLVTILPFRFKFFKIIFLSLDFVNSTYFIS